MIGKGLHFTCSGGTRLDPAKTTFAVDGSCWRSGVVVLVLLLNGVGFIRQSA